MERNSKFLSSLLWLLTTMGLAIVCLIAVPEHLKAQTNTFPSSGNVGVGTTNPTQGLLEVNKNQNAGTNTVIDNGYTTSGNAAFSGLILRQAGANRFHLVTINDNNSTHYGGAGAVQFWNFANGPFLFANNNAETMRLTAGGSLGLGTSTPGTFFGGVAGSGRFLHIGNTSDHASLLLSAMGAGKVAAVSFEVSDAMLGRRAFQTRYDGANNLVKSFFFNEANGVVMQDNVLVLKNTGFVGIGTASPTRPLEVLAADGEAMRLYRNGNTVNFGVNVRFALNNSSGSEVDYAGVHGQIASNTAGAEGGNLLFSTATSGTATEKVRITSAGNVGVGTITPGYRLDVQGGQLNTSGGLCIAGDCKTAWSQVGGTSQWTTSGSNVYYSTGSVGLGIASPAVQFHLVNSSTAQARIESSGNAAVALDFKNPSRRWVVGAGLNSGVGDFSIYDANAAATRMYFDTSGNVGIGTTSPGTMFGGISGPGRYLHIGNSSDHAQLILSAGGAGKLATFSFEVGDATATKRVFQTRYDGANNIVKSFFFNGTNGTVTQDNVLVLSNNGNIGMGTASPGTSLDISGNSLTVGSDIGGTSRTTNTTKLARVAMPAYTSGNLPFALVSGATTSTANIAAIGGEVGGMSAATQIDFLTAASTNVDTGTIRMTVNSAGNVGIGTTSPSTKLDVNGTINATALTVNGNAVGGSQWTTSGTTINYGGGNVGIGTSAPTSKLHVAGDGKITGNLVVDGNIAAKYQDVAEWVNSSQALAVGTVVVLDQTKSNQVIASTSSYDTRVAGVISAQPGIALGEGGAGKVLVATTGRVRIKVDASSGSIHIGDLLVTSDIPGVAMRSQPVNIGGVQIHRPGTLIGKALENLESGKGEMLVLLSLQ